MGSDTKVRLRGDDKELNKALARSHSNIQNWGGSVGTILKAVGAAVVVKKLLSFGSAVLDLAREQDRAERRIASVLKATGNAAGFTAEQLGRVASSMQNQIGIGDELILNTMAIIGTFKNVRGDVFLEATTLAADMAEVLGGDAASKATQLGKALNDPLKGMSALAEAGVGFTDQQKEQVRVLQQSGDMMGAQGVILDELRGQFGGAAEEANSGFFGAIDRVWMKLGGLGERIGGLLVPGMYLLSQATDFVINALDAVIPSGQVSMETMEAFAGSIKSTVAPAFEFMKEAGLVAFSYTEFAIKNMQERADYHLTAFALAAVKSFAIAKHWLTRVIPDAAMWLMRNWKEVLGNMANLTTTVFLNMGKNVAGFFSTVKSWLSGSPEAFKFTSLTEGFELSLSELPEIAERIPGVAEKIMEGQLGRMGASLDGKYQDILAKNREAVEGFSMGQQDDLEDVRESAEGVSKEFDTAQKKKGKLAGFEDLDALFDRIADSALKSGPKEVPAEVVASMDAAPGANMEQASVAQDLEPALEALGDKIVGSITGLKRTIPNVGRMS